MEKIYDVSNPEIVLKQLKKYYGDKDDLYLSTSKTRNIWYTMKKEKKSILEI